MADMLAFCCCEEEGACPTDPNCFAPNGFMLAFQGIANCFPADNGCPAFWNVVYQVPAGGAPLGCTGVLLFGGICLPPTHFVRWDLSATPPCRISVIYGTLNTGTIFTNILTSYGGGMVVLPNQNVCVPPFRGVGGVCTATPL